MALRRVLRQRPVFLSGRWRRYLVRDSSLPFWQGLSEKTRERTRTLCEERTQRDTPGSLGPLLPVPLDYYRVRLRVCFRTDPA